MKLGKEFLETVANMNLPKPQTNADRIRAMSDDELAKHLCCPYFLCRDLDMSCKKCISLWLKSPVEVDNGT